jgi:hypothetical protein
VTHGGSSSLRFGIGSFSVVVLGADDTDAGFGTPKEDAPE